jgi:hypothetical protein
MRQLLYTFSIVCLMLAGGVTSARAAPGGDEQVKNIYDIKITLPKMPMCAHSTAKVRVTATFLSQDIKDGKEVSGRSGMPVGGTKVASLAGGNVDIKPSVQPLTTGWIDSKYDAAGEVTFDLFTHEAGKGFVVFDAQFFNGKTRTISKAITIVNCEYTVNMNHRGNWTAPASSAGGSDSGFVAMTISGESGHMTGSGTMTFATNIWIKACGTGTASIAPVPITVNGDASDTGLELSLDYPATLMGGGTFVCPFIGAVTGFGSKPLSDFLAFKSASLPAEGGSVTYDFGCLSGAGSCSLTITAEPKEGSG